MKTLARSRRRSPLRIEALEARDTPSAVTESWADNSFAQYQPLNGDTNYTVAGKIDSLADVDYYAFYAPARSAIRAGVRAAVTTGNIHTEFDPTIGLFTPDGTLVAAADGGGYGSIGAARVTYTATEAGVWRVAVSHHGDLTFDGSSPVRPSWNPNDPTNTGPGLHTGAYTLMVVGAAKPQIQVDSPAAARVFYIDGNNPAMPAITAELTGIAPDPSGSTAYTWRTRVMYWAPDYPAVPGPGRSIASPLYDDHTAIGTAEFTPDFTVEGSELIRGGRLLLTATTKVGNQTLQVSTPNSGPTRLLILGENPDPAVVHAYIDAIPVPANWPPDTQYDFHLMVRKIIAEESSVGQFWSNGVPYWSEDGRLGVGLMQLTDPAPTADQTWDWRRNIDAGVQLLTDYMDFAHDRLDALTALVQSLVPSNVVVAPPSGDMYVLEAVRAYNALDNGTGPKDEYRPVRLNGQIVVVPNGSGGSTTEWEHVPVSVRGTTKGDANYVDDVLGQDDF
jgi:hypothetical protein